MTPKPLKDQQKYDTVNILAVVRKVYDNELERGKGKLQESSKIEFAAMQQALLRARTMEATRSQELALCQDNLDACKAQVEAVKFELAAAQNDRDTSKSLLHTFQADSNAMNQRIVDLQTQLERARAATARAKLSTHHSGDKKTKGKGDSDSKSDLTAASVSRSDKLDASVFVQQLDVAHKRLTKVMKVCRIWMCVFRGHESQSSCKQVRCGTGQSGSELRA